MYLRLWTGVEGKSWPSYPAYLLFDEAQQSYWDGELWAAFFKHIDPDDEPSTFVVLFSSYSSPGRGNAGFDEQKYIKTPMTFSPEQLITLQPNEHIDPDSVLLIESGEGILRPVGLLLEEDEAMDVMKRYSDIKHLSPPLPADLKREFFLISDGHVGVLRGLLNTLTKAPVSVLRNL